MLAIGGGVAVAAFLVRTRHRHGFGTGLEGHLGLNVCAF